MKKLISLLLTLAVVLTTFNVFAKEDILYGGKVPHVVGIQLKNEDMAAPYMAKVKSAGFGYARKGVYWGNIEKAKGVYDWSQTDAWVKSMEDHGLSILMTVAWNNRIYEDIWDRAIITEEGRQAFAGFVTELVEHYKGKDIIYEIWNEPNLRSFWHENDIGKSNTAEMAKEYTEMCIDAVPAMKKADPNCRVAICSISALWSQSFDWFRNCVSSGILKCGADYISVHPYGFVYPELAMRDGYPVIRSILDENGYKDMGIINSEVGFSTTYLMEHGATEENVDEMQGWCLVRQNMVDMMSGVELTTWYEMSDPKWGIIDNNLTERPAHKAASVLTKELAGFEYLYRIAMGSPNDYVLVFGNDKGEQKIVAWVAPDPSTPSDAKLSVPHDASIPVGVTGSHKVVQTYGETSTATSTDGIIQVHLTGGPIYIDNVKLTEAPKDSESTDVTVPVEDGNSSISVVLNSKTVDFDVPPQLINDRTMVPIRAIFEAMGATVTWDDETETATAVKGDTTVKMKIDSSVIDINGKRSFMDVSPVLVDDRTLAPARYVAEAFGGTVYWDEYTNTVRITLVE